MTPELLKILHQCYNKSEKNKETFFKLVFSECGLKKQAFERGSLFDFINTAVWDK